jgi:hypothetical protein
MTTAIQFDANTVAPDTGTPTTVPRGRYSVVMTKAELAPTKNGAGKLVNMEHTIMQGDFAGNIIKSNINWENPSASCQRIGRSQFSAICHATGVIAVQDLQQLYNKPFGIEVENDGRYNNINRYMSLDTMAELPPMGVAPEPRAQTPAGSFPAPVAGPPVTTGAPPAQPFTPPVNQPQQQVVTQQQQPAFTQGATAQPAHNPQNPAQFVANQAPTGQSAQVATTSPSDPQQQVVEPTDPNQQPTAQPVQPSWVQNQENAQQ